MGRVRRAVVGTAVVVICLYFLVGLLGFLPYQYDFIKKAVYENQSTEFKVVENKWTTALSIDAFSNIQDMITYKGNMYFVAKKSGGEFEIWRMDTAQQKELVYSHTFIMAVDKAFLINYFDRDGNTVLYAVITGGYYVSETTFYGSYDGDSWSDSNPKFIPNSLTDLSDVNIDSLIVKGKELYIGSHFQISILVRVFDANTWGFVSAKKINIIDDRYTAMCVYTAPAGYSTVYISRQGSGYYYASVYYWDTTLNKWNGAFTMPSSSGVRTITAMTVFDGNMWIGSSVGLFYYWNSGTPSTIIPITTPLYATQQVLCLDSYENQIYGGSSNNGIITKYDGTGMVKDYSTLLLNVYSFNTFNSKFYASVDNYILVYFRMTIYTYPMIMHTPVTKGAINIPTKITARISDESGINSAVLSYQEEGKILKTVSMNLNVGTGEESGGKWVNGTYSAEIPAVTLEQNITYFITATNSDGNRTFTPTFTITILKELIPTIWGLDYRILYLIAIALTLIIGYVAYGRREDDKPSSWRRSRD